MMDRFYNGNKLVEEYSAFGEVQVNEMSRVARIIPFIEQRVEVIIDSSVGDDVAEEDIPPHLKASIDLFFINSPAIYPVKHMIQCVEPGKLQTYNGRAWVDITYRDEWEFWEELVGEMERIHYPFVVLPNCNIFPRTWNLLEESRMRIFRTLLEQNNPQVTIKEFEEKWVHLFNPAHRDNPELPIAAWLSVSGTAGSYVDVIEITSDRQAIILFTVPPLMSFNDGETSVLDGKTPINIQNLIMRCRSESAVVPMSGEQRLINTFNEASGKSESMTKHLQMWKIIYDRYGWEFITDVNNDVSNDTTKVSDGNRPADEDKMEDIVF